MRTHVNIMIIKQTEKLGQQNKTQNWQHHTLWCLFERKNINIKIYNYCNTPILKIEVWVLLSERPLLLVTRLNAIRVHQTLICSKIWVCVSSLPHSCAYEWTSVDVCAPVSYTLACMCVQGNQRGIQCSSWREGLWDGSCGTGRFLRTLKKVPSHPSTARASLMPSPWVRTHILLPTEISFPGAV